VVIINLEFVYIIIGIVTALIAVGIIVGGLSKLPDWGKGLVLILFLLYIAGSLIYAIIQPPIDEPAGPPDLVQQHR
jgi:hypothetical protein